MHLDVRPDALEGRDRCGARPLSAAQPPKAKLTPGLPHFRMIRNKKQFNAEWYATLHVASQAGHSARDSRGKSGNKMCELFTPFTETEYFFDSATTRATPKDRLGKILSQLCVRHQPLHSARGHDSRDRVVGDARRLVPHHRPPPRVGRRPPHHLVSRLAQRRRVGVDAPPRGGVGRRAASSDGRGGASATP